MTIKAKKSKINLREKLAELLNFRQIRDRLDGLGLYLGKDRTGTAENLAVRGGANVDDLQLAEISAAVGGTAVDVFVYDTRNDSDGGKWRERTSHTSWYNEPLNTTTRGSRREFPAVAVIVAEADKVTIYDGDDPDLSMWMKYPKIDAAPFGHLSKTPTCCAAINGKIFIGSDSNLQQWDFIEDFASLYGTGGYYAWLNPQIANRTEGSNSGGTTPLISSSIRIVNNAVNDVAMTVLPNAPIDADTGLPIPTIAVATDGGISVIKDDGSVVDITGHSNSILFVGFNAKNQIITQGEWQGDTAIYEVPSSDIAYDSSARLYHFGRSANDGSEGYGSYPYTLGYNAPLSYAESSSSDFHRSTIGGLTSFSVADTQSSSMVAYTTSSYNTGWMPGDIKLAALSDTKNETVGVDETTELVTNGGFGNDDTSGWTLSGSPTITFSTSGVIDVTGDGEGLYQDIAPGTYLVSVGTISGTGGEVRFTDMDSLTQLFAASQSGDSLVITSIGNLRVYIRASGNNLASFDNISVKQTGELITNGTFDNGTEGWTGGNGATIIEDGGKIKITSTTGGNGYAYQQINTIAGRKYIMTFDFFAVDGSTALAWIGTSAGGGQTLQETFSGAVDSSRVLEFTATSSIHYIRIGANETAVRSYMFDNISIRLAEDDRSVNDNGLQVFGEITKTPVAPGADLVAYSGFSANNYLMQPYNSDLDFGTGDFSVMGWFKSYTTSNAGIIYSRRPQSSNINGLEIGVNTDGTLYVYTIEDSQVNSSGTATTGKPIVRNVWNNFCAVRSGQTINLYVNGVLHSSTTNTIRDLTNTSAELCLGIYGDQSSLAFEGEISLIRVSTTVPTPDQIAKIYRDEKVLFTDGAQATLYGTSDAVTALAYDDKTELLHVGTSSGRSDFSGLRRINNTTTAVTTSISASNNLIAEQ